jgi:8-oxo-dGTP pyrophosphatase MutT (NUDIX family)
MLYKVLVAPFIRTERNTIKYLFVHDRAFSEWTLVSGGRKLSESAEGCACRELHEETRHTLHLHEEELRSKGASFDVQVQEEKNLTTTYTVFFVELENLTCTDAARACRLFHDHGAFSKETNENDDMSFLTIREAAACATLWPFIRKVLCGPKFQSMHRRIQLRKRIDRDARW